MHLKQSDFRIRGSKSIVLNCGFPLILQVDYNCGLASFYVAPTSFTDIPPAYVFFFLMLLLFRTPT